MRAFTLIELLVTISIIGILSSISFVMYDSYRRLANDTLVVVGMKNSFVGIETFRSENEFVQALTLHIGVDGQDISSSQSSSTLSYRDLAGFIPQKGVEMHIQLLSDHYQSGAGHCYGSKHPTSGNTVAKVYSSTIGFLDFVSTSSLKADGSDC